MLPATTLWGADLEPTSPSANVKGALGGVSQSGQTRLTMQVTLGEDGATYGWRVSKGDCSSEGDVVAGKAVYPPLMVTDGGSASALAVIAGELTSGESYAARIFSDSGTGGEQVLACGNLRQTK